MTTQQFLDLLDAHPEKELLFEYQPNQFVAKAYHISEIKNALFETVDCGGNHHDEYQTIAQIWVNPLEVSSRYMTAAKARKIFNIVDATRPLRLQADMRIEYGDTQRPTSHFTIDKVKIDTNRLLVKMSVPNTLCKPAQLANLAASVTSCCGPNSNCCS
ncbi:MAG: DUF6428 family protein [Bacteroidota bacterium]